MENKIQKKPQDHIIHLNIHCGIPLKKKFTSIFNKKDVSKIISFMKSDKKNTTKKINIILIKDFGKIKTNYQFDQNTLKQFLISELKK